MSRQHAALAACALATTALPGVSRADDRATAQQLFQQGRELAAAGDLEHACPKFEAAAQMSPTAGVRLNLAECWAKTGRTASAWTKFDEALEVALVAKDRAAAAIARKGRADLEPLLSYITVVVGPETAVPGLVLKRDGQILPPAAWGVAIPVDPGKHEVTAGAPGRRSWSTSEAAPAPGARGTTTIPALLVEESVAPAGPVAEPPDVHRESPRATSGGTQRLVGWVAGGAGAAGLLLGGAFAIDAIVKKGDYRARMTASGRCEDPSCQTNSYAAASAGNVATGGFIVGGVLIAAGVALLLTAPPPARAVGLSVDPRGTASGLATVTQW